MMSFSAVAPEIWIAAGVLAVVGFEALRSRLPGNFLKTAIPATALLALALALIEALDQMFSEASAVKAARSAA